MRESEVFKIVLEILQTKVSPQTFVAYFKELDIISIIDNRVTLSCKSSLVKSIIESRFYITLLNIFKETLGKDVELEFKIYSGSKKITKDDFSLFDPKERFPNTANSKSKKSASPILNAKYIFDNFIVGSNNQLAHAAALAIADNPGNAYNPFFIYGNVGLGKTHLMQAIGNKIFEKDNSAKILYCTTETFLNEMVHSIRTQKTTAFREKYRKLDVLMLDDIQFLSNKEALQEEFFNTFNTLYQSGKQIIIASDRPPSDISHLEDRIRSRFEGGLVADIKNPNVETRIAIIQKKLIERNEYLPENIINSIAEIISTNIRELEGALLKASIFYKTTGDINASDLETLLGSKLYSSKNKKINPLDIMKFVAETLDIELKDIKGVKRNYDISYARQVCMYLLKDILNLQLLKIAKHVGRKDHTTIIHGIKKMEDLISKDTEIKQQILDIRSKILSN